MEFFTETFVLSQISTAHSRAWGGELLKCSNSAHPAAGDAYVDGFVNAADLRVWTDQFAALNYSEVLTTVPEPSRRP